MASTTDTVGLKLPGVAKVWSVAGIMPRAERENGVGRTITPMNGDTVWAQHAISLITIDPVKTQKITLNLSDEKSEFILRQDTLIKKIQDYNSFNEPEKIKPAIFKDAVIDKKSLTVTLPAASVVVLTIK